MGVKDHLTTTEEIVGNISCAHGVKYYVTGKRVIRYRQTATREEMDDLLCNHITSISMVSKFRKAWVITGIVLLVIAGIAQAVKYLTMIEGYSTLTGGLENYYSYACYVSIVLGVFLIILGFIRELSYYQYIAAGLTGDIAERWRIMGVNAEAARKFIRLVRESV